MTPATSSGCPTRRRGTCSATAAWKSSNGTPSRCRLRRHRGRDEAGSDAVHPDVEAPELDRESFVSPWMPAFAAE